jgi:hypothetical protein
LEACSDFNGYLYYYIDDAVQKNYILSQRRLDTFLKRKS